MPQIPKAIIDRMARPYEDAHSNLTRLRDCLKQVAAEVPHIIEELDRELEQLRRNYEAIRCANQSQ